MIDNNYNLGVLTTDSELRILSWNSILEEFTSVLESEAKGKILTKLFPEIEERGFTAKLKRVLTEGTVEVFSSAFHKYFIKCLPRYQSSYFNLMQQHTTIAPLTDGESIVGLIITIEDVTALLEYEREKYNLPIERDKEDETVKIDLLEHHDWRVRKGAVSKAVSGDISNFVSDLLLKIKNEHKNFAVLNSAMQVLTRSGYDTIDALVSFLKSDDKDLRIYTCQILGEKYDTRAISALIEALKDEDANVKYHAIESLGKLRAYQSVDKLVEVALSNDFFVAFPALDALRLIGESRVSKKLIPLLDDDILGSTAAETLSVIGDEGIVSPLINKINKGKGDIPAYTKALAELYNRYEKNYGEGNFIIELVKDSINSDGKKHLLETLKSTDTKELKYIVTVLGWLEGDGIEQILTKQLGNPHARKEIIEALIRYGNKVTDLLIKQLESEDIEITKSALIALGKIGDNKCVPYLVRIFDAEDEIVILAADTLAKIGDRSAYNDLLKLLGHPNSSVRRAAVAALNSLGHPQMPQDILTLINDPNKYVRESAIKIAGYFGFPECKDSVIKALNDEDEIVRCSALESLPYFDDPQTVNILANTLKNDAPKVRASAAQVISHLEDVKDAIYLLNIALEDEDQWVRMNAIRSIANHKIYELLDDLEFIINNDKSAPVRITALDAIGKIGGSRAISILSKYINDDNIDIAEIAIHSLGKLNHPDAIHPLMQALKSNNPRKKIMALKSIGMRGGTGAAGALQWIVLTDKNPTVIEFAIDALKNLGTSEAIAVLLNLTSDFRFRESAIDALSKQDSSNIESVAKGLISHNLSIRSATVEALLRMKNSLASELIGKALEDHEPSIRMSALSALSKLGNKTYLKQISVIAERDVDPNVRAYAKNFIQKMNNEVKKQ